VNRLPEQLRLPERQIDRWLLVLEGKGWIIRNRRKALGLALEVDEVDGYQPSLGAFCAMTSMLRRGTPVLGSCGHIGDPIAQTVEGDRTTGRRFVDDSRRRPYPHLRPGMIDVDQDGMVTIADPNLAAWFEARAFLEPHFPDEIADACPTLGCCQ